MSSLLPNTGSGPRTLSPALNPESSGANETPRPERGQLDGASDRPVTRQSSHLCLSGSVRSLTLSPTFCRVAIHNRNRAGRAIELAAVHAGEKRDRPDDHHAQASYQNNQKEIVHGRTDAD